MKYLIMAVSALALAATPPLAQGNGNGDGNGNGNGNRGGGSAQADRSNPGNGNSQRGNRASDERGSRQDNQGANRGGGNANRSSNGRSERDQASRGRENGNSNGNGNAVRGRDYRGNGNQGGNNRGNDNQGSANRGNGNRSNGPSFDDRGRDGGLIDRILYRETGIADGCPPGLAAKRNGCLPPGQARKRNDNYRYGNYAPNWWGLPYSGGNYFYEDGFLLRYDGNRVSGYIPLLGGALAIGNSWPRDYGYDRIPDYQSRFYGLGSNYRYADNVVYRLDPETAAITSIAALLTGDEFVVGQPAPRGYDVYNVPYSYRDRYRDGPDAYYRYNDGYVYQIDPETRLIASAIELLL